MNSKTESAPVVSKKLQDLYVERGSREKFGTNLVMYGSTQNTCSCSSCGGNAADDNAPQ